jgi:hypothetical protein
MFGQAHVVCERIHTSLGSHRLLVCNRIMEPARRIADEVEEDRCGIRESAVSQRLSLFGLARAGGCFGPRYGPPRFELVLLSQRRATLP